MKRIAFVTVLAIFLAAGPALAAKDYDWKLFVGASYVSPLSSSDLTIEDVRDSVEAASEVGWEIGGEWRPTGLFGVELSYVNATHDVEFGGTKIGEIDLKPINVSLNLHLIQGKFIDFWVAPTVAFVDWGDIKLIDGDSVSTDGETTGGASVGIDIGLGKSIAITGGLRWLALDLQSSDGGESVGVDPLFARVGIAFRF